MLFFLDIYVQVIYKGGEFQISTITRRLIKVCNKLMGHFFLSNCSKL